MSMTISAERIPATRGRWSMHHIQQMTFRTESNPEWTPVKQQLTGQHPWIDRPRGGNVHQYVEVPLEVSNVHPRSSDAIHQDNRKYSNRRTRTVSEESETTQQRLTGIVRISATMKQRYVHIITNEKWHINAIWSHRKTMYPGREHRITHSWEPPLRGQDDQWETA